MTDTTPDTPNPLDAGEIGSHADYIADLNYLDGLSAALFGYATNEQLARLAAADRGPNA